MAAVFFAGAAFAAVPPAAAAGDRRVTTLRAAEAALPASDRVVLRAMVSLPGTRVQTREGVWAAVGYRHRRGGRVYPPEPPLKEGTPVGTGLL